MKTNKVVLASAVRTPYGRFCGALKDYDYYDLGALPMNEVVSRVNFPNTEVEELFWGIGDTSVCKDAYTPLASRQSALHAGFPDNLITLCIDRACVSGSSATRYAFRFIKLGEIECAISGGATSFSRTPFILRGVRNGGFKLGNAILEDPLYKLGYKDFDSMIGQISGLAREHNIDRAEQDEWALKSHMCYKEAYDSGKFNAEIMKIDELDIDEQFRRDTTLEKLGKLKPVNGNDTITAGNSPGLNDGAAALLIMSEEKALRHSLTPIAEIVEMSSMAINPHKTAEAPAAAVFDVLEKANLKFEDMSFMEINEAFAAVALVSIKVIAGNNRAKMEKIKEITNINGSAIAIGHANTSSGARVIMNLAYELQRRGEGYAIGAIGGALGLGDAFILKAYEN